MAKHVAARKQSAFEAERSVRTECAPRRKGRGKATFGDEPTLQPQTTASSSAIAVQLMSGIDAATTSYCDDDNNNDDDNDDDERVRLVLTARQPNETVCVCVFVLVCVSCCATRGFSCESPQLTVT